MKKKEYIAITIGPLLRTMDLVSSPAALWASSYMFSYISRRIRARLIDRESDHPVDEECFISPYVAKGDQILDRTDGLGLLHDHIIFEKPEGFTMAHMKAIRDDVYDEVWKCFGLDQFRQINADYLKQYIMIAAVAFEGTNPIMDSSKMLDCLEFPAKFVPEEKANPILALFDAKDAESRNTNIKQLAEPLGIQESQWQLLDRKGQVRDLRMIAAGDQRSDLKKYRYYAVVRSDGDNMGKLISSLQNKEQFHLFSSACLDYCERIAQKVKAYHGLTVYAGGDDLLALMPCQTQIQAKDSHEKSDVTIIDFVKDANRLFDEIFNNEENGAITGIIRAAGDETTQKAFKKVMDQLPRPSLTYGITLCHIKYPLFEALSDSASLLFDAKGHTEAGYKNAVHLRLIKHSGQTSSICIQNEALNNDAEASCSKVFRDVATGQAEQTQSEKMKKAEPTEEAEDSQTSSESDTDQVLLSAMHKLKAFEALFDGATADQPERQDQNAAASTAIYNLFQNVFDAAGHEGNTFVHRTLPHIYATDCLTGHISALNKDGEREKSPVLAMYQYLRILRFFVEKAGDKE